MDGRIDGRLGKGGEGRHVYGQGLSGSPVPSRGDAEVHRHSE